MARLKRSQTSTVRDARGRRVPSVSIRNLTQADTDPDGRRRALVQQLNKHTKDTAWKIAGAHAMWIVIAAFVWSRMEDRIVGRHAFQGLPRVAAIVGVLALIVVIVWWSASRAVRLRRARLSVKAGFCGSCAYDLKGLQPSHDGNVVCPECGSAWCRMEGRASP